MKNEIERLIEAGEYTKATCLAETLGEFEKNYYIGVIAIPNSEIDWGVKHLLKAFEISDKSVAGRRKKTLVQLQLVFLYQIGGEFKLAHKILNEITTKLIKTDLELGLYLLTRALQLNYEGKREDAIARYHKAAEVFETNQEFVYASFCYLYLVLYNPSDKKLDYVEKARSLVRKANNERRYAYISCFKGYQHQTLGDYNNARNLNQYAYDNSSKLNYKLGITNSSFCLARIGLEEGRIKYALDQFNQLDDRNFELTRVIFENYSKILSYRLIGDISQAHELAITSINRFKQYVNSTASIGLLYLQYVLITIELGNVEEAKKYQQEFTNLVGNSDDSELKSYINLIKALILKQNKSIRDIIKAQDILNDILKETKTIEFQIRIEATRHLCELLIQEYEFDENKEVLNKAQKLIADLDRLAEEHYLIRTRFEIGILRSKIFLLQGNLEKSKNYLEELKKRAESQDLAHFERRIEKEITLIKNNFQKWIEVINNNQSLKALIDEFNIKDYFTAAIQYRDELDTA